MGRVAHPAANPDLTPEEKRERAGRRGVPEPDRLGWRAFVRKADKQRAGLVGAILTCRAKAGRTRTFAAVHRGIPRAFCRRGSPPAPCIVGAQTPLLGGTRRPRG
ncbi:hypothetical protein GCM10023306_04290 [Novosphingobium ginsenosidimutans]